MPDHPVPVRFLRRRLVVAVGAAVLVAVVFAVEGLVLDPDPTGAPTRPSATGASTTTSAPAVEPERSAPTSTTMAPSTGRFDVAPGGSTLVGSGRTYRYRVEVEQGVGVEPAAFAAEVDRILGDPRGWTTVDGISLQRVSDGSADFAVRLATPHTTDLLCLPLDTEGQVSCGTNAMAVINLTRWRVGADPPHLSVADYRNYLISHEFGHLLGHDHVGCPGPGRPAPVMMQQTYTIADCAPNAWPATGG